MILLQLNNEIVFGENGIYILLGYLFDLKGCILLIVSSGLLD